MYGGVWSWQYLFSPNIASERIVWIWVSFNRNEPKVGNENFCKEAKTWSRLQARRNSGLSGKWLENAF